MLMFYSVDFDIVIATMNRQDALLLSLPLMLTQERLPSRLIVVDASDDHQRTKRVVEEAVEAAGAVVEVVTRPGPLPDFATSGIQGSRRSTPRSSSFPTMTQSGSRATAMRS